MTHGNGPQVGTRLLEVEAADAPDRPLDVLVAETQAVLGALLRRGLDPALDRPVAGVLTRVVVDADDPAFDEPDKPAGPWYTEVESAELPFETARIGDGDRPRHEPLLRRRNSDGHETRTVPGRGRRRPPGRVDRRAGRRDPRVPGRGSPVSGRAGVLRRGRGRDTPAL